LALDAGIAGADGMSNLQPGKTRWAQWSDKLSISNQLCDIYDINDGFRILLCAKK
jgi:hypothetical protein